MTFDDIVVERIKKICENKSLENQEKIIQIKEECNFAFLASDETREKIEKFMNDVDPFQFPVMQPNVKRAETKSKIRKAVTDDINYYGKPEDTYTIDGVNVDVVYETDNHSETLSILY